MEMQEYGNCGLMGELYHLCEAEYDETTGDVTKILRSHYLLRINQYLRATAPLLLRLGMNIKRLYELNFKWLDVQDSKVFKLLSDCFSRKSSGKAYHFHLFLQVGEYTNFKE
jgi:hypothetical protein